MHYTDGVVKWKTYMSVNSRPSTGWIQSHELQMLAEKQPPGEIREALINAAKEITCDREYIDYLHATYIPDDI